MPVAILNEDHLRVAHELIKLGAARFDNTKDALYALIVAIFGIASLSSNPPEALENVIALIAQNETVKGRPIAVVVCREVDRIMKANAS